jgi:hypothetical protein
MRTEKSIYITIFSFVFFACSESSSPSANQKNISKQDSLAQVYDLSCKATINDSSLVNINRCIQLALNDSTQEIWISNRRKMYMSQSSFNKLKVDAEEVLKNNPCYAPIIINIDRINNEHYNWQDLYNENFERSDYKSSRFVVADFNTQDAKGNCKGCQEEFPDVWEIQEVKSFLQVCYKNKVNLYDNRSIEEWLAGLKEDERKKWSPMLSIWYNLRDHVEAYRTEPLKKDPIIEVSGKKYCIGQRLCLCEIQGDTIIKVAQFVTSSKNAAAAQNNQRDYDGQRRYYAPMNRLTTRYWDDRLVYDSLDKKRDAEMGFSSKHVITYKGKVPLPNFIHITPDDAFPGAKGFVNGIHEFAVGGSVPGKYMGTPISLGCVRLHDYPSKFIRWWTPANAKMFIYYEDKRYKQSVPESSSDS